MSKKLLSEAEMRRFMGLAGIRPPVIKSRIQETYSGPMTERDPMDQEEGPMPEDPEMPGDEVGAPEMMDQPEDLPAPEDSALDGLSDEAKEELFSAVANAAAEILDLDIDMEMADAGAPEEPPEMDAAPEMPPVLDDKEDDEPAALEEEDTTALEEEDTTTLEEENVTLELSEEEIVNEVARRVAKRLVRASKANKTLKEALGRK